MYVNFMSCKNSDGHKKLLVNTIGIVYMLSNLKNSAFLLTLHLKLISKLCIALKKTRVEVVKSELNRFFAIYMINPEPLEVYNNKLNPYLRYLLRLRYQLNNNKDDSLAIERRGFDSINSMEMNTDALIFEGRLDNRI